MKFLILQVVHIYNLKYMSVFSPKFFKKDNANQENIAKKKNFEHCSGISKIVDVGYDKLTIFNSKKGKSLSLKWNIENDKYELIFVKFIIVN